MVKVLQGGCVNNREGDLLLPLLLYLASFPSDVILRVERLWQRR